MKLATTTMVTVDGVMQGLGGPDEDRRGGFERGGWVTPYVDDEGMGFLNEVYGRADVVTRSLPRPGRARPTRPRVPRNRSKRESGSKVAPDVKHPARAVRQCVRMAIRLGPRSGL